MFAPFAKSLTALALVTGSLFAIGTPADGQCKLTDSTQSFKATVYSGFTAGSLPGCSTQGVMAFVLVQVKDGTSSCAGSSTLAYRCVDDSNTLGFVACGSAHLFTPVSGATWGAIAGGLCSYLEYIRI